MNQKKRPSQKVNCLMTFILFVVVFVQVVHVHYWRLYTACFHSLEQIFTDILPLRTSVYPVKWSRTIAIKGQKSIRLTKRGILSVVCLEQRCHWASALTKPVSWHDSGFLRSQAREEEGESLSLSHLHTHR